MSEPISKYISVYDAGHEAGSGVMFGIDLKKMACVLREIAERMDNGQIIVVEKFTVLTLAEHDEFSKTFLRMTLTESANPEEAKLRKAEWLALRAVSEDGKT